MTQSAATMESTSEAARAVPVTGGGVSGPRRPMRRSVFDRITLPTVIGVIAALLVFVLTALLLRDRREVVTVAVASERIPAGATITPSMVHPVDMPTSVSFSVGLVRVDELGGRLVAARTLQPGEPLSRTALGSAEAANGARVMAIPVDSWQAVGGQVDVGDQIDVIDTGGDAGRYVLTRAAVVGRASSDTGGGLVASSSDGLWVTVEVSATEALDLASVIEGGKFVLVRSTGAPDEVPVAAATGAPGSAATESKAVPSDVSGG